MANDQKAILRDAEWASVRAARNRLLRATDHTQVMDSPLSEQQRAEVAEYRRVLREIPEKAADPFAVVWPEKPTFLK